MSYSSQLHVEVAGPVATIYMVSGLATAAQLVRACNELPPDVEVLRLDVDGIEWLGKSELLMIDELRLHWRSTRRGAFRIAATLQSRRGVTYEARLGM